MTLENKYGATELHCSQKEHMLYHKALTGRFCWLIIVCMEFILTASLIKVGQMVRVVVMCSLPDLIPLMAIYW